MAEPKVLVIIHGPTQRLCPVRADTKEQAWELISQELGYDVRGYPVFDIDDDDDLESIVQHIEKSSTGGN